jgi:hypothetical protein
VSSNIFKLTFYNKWFIVRDEGNKKRRNIMLKMSIRRENAGDIIPVSAVVGVCSREMSCIEF